MNEEPQRVRLLALVELLDEVAGCSERLELGQRSVWHVASGYFNPHIWHPALEAAGVEPSRKNGMHALRHFYASALIDAGESVKAVAEYLGHADPGFTLRVYAHLFPSSEARAR